MIIGQFMTFQPDQTPEPSIDLSIFDSATDLMCVRDLQGRLVRVNRAWQDTLGLSVDEVANTPLLPLVHPADVPATLLRMTEADRCEQVVNFVNRYRRKDGSYRYMEWRAQRLGDVVLGRARDVTTIRLRESELNCAMQRWEDTLADLSCQVRAPADEIMSTVEALGRTTLTHAQRVMVQRLGRSVETLGALLSELVVREREGIWSTILPTHQGHPLATDHSVKVSSPFRAPLSTSREASGDRYSGLVGPAAPQAWLVDTLRLIDGNRHFSSIFRDLPTQILGLQSIYLDHEGQLYSRRLQSVSTGSGFMSAGRAVALLARMQDAGFVETMERHQVGHMLHYRVLPALVQPLAQQLIINLQSIAISNYRAVVALDSIESDGSRLPALLVRYAEAFMVNDKCKQNKLGHHLNGVPSSAQGHAIAISIAAAAMEKNGPTWGGWIEIDLAAYAMRFGVSRVHVRRIMNNLAPCGVLRDLACPSRLLVTNLFREEVTKYWKTICYPLTSLLENIV